MEALLHNKLQKNYPNLQTDMRSLDWVFSICLIILKDHRWDVCIPFHENFGRLHKILLFKRDFPHPLPPGVKFRALTPSENGWICRLNGGDRLSLSLKYSEEYIGIEKKQKKATTD